MRDANQNPVDSTRIQELDASAHQSSNRCMTSFSGLLQMLRNTLSSGGTLSTPVAIPGRERAGDAWIKPGRRTASELYFRWPIHTNPD